jgi:ATP-dependent RNA helicase SUPV3L1/SUV3
MFGFSVPKSTPATTSEKTVTTPTKSQEPHPLDAMTGGAFSAQTAGERAQRIRDWLAGNPSVEQIQQVFTEISVRDRGAAKPLREKLDELKRAKGQEVLAAEWARKASALLELPKVNMADAMAWQRDAAKAGAPLSKEPLASLKVQLADRVKGIEDLQHRVQVQREAAVLLAQRIEVLSTKPWRDAQAALEVLRADVSHWQEQAGALAVDPNWASVDPKFPTMLEASKGQLLVVWDAFQAALTATVAASEDANAPLPPVTVWADELRVARGVPLEADAKPARTERAPRAPVDPALREAANKAVQDALTKVEQEVAEGHGKASAGAAAALRNALKEHNKLVDEKLGNAAQAALAAAGELEGWQRWRADQLREELLIKAEGLLKRPEGHALGGRKMQETLRAMREQWKQTDQGGVPNHALWKRFDDACNEAHKVVEAWLEKVKAESAEHKAQRLALIEEVKAWAADNTTAKDGDWKGFNRVLHQFGDRWREAGHLGEKAFAEMQPLWKEAIGLAAAPLENLQKESVERRHAMIEEAKVLGAAPVLRIDAVKALQQRWQAEAQGVPMDRKFEQKLWDAFRKPIDDAFNRKTEEREKAASALSDRDRIVLEAAKALEAANATGDAAKIRTAMNNLDAALRGQAQAQAAVNADKADAAAQSAAQAESQAAAPVAEKSEAAVEGEPATDAAPAAEATSEEAPAPEAAAPVEPPKAPKKPVVAMRGDDRPGMKKTEPAAAGRGGKFGDRKDGPRGAPRPGDNKFEPIRSERPSRDGGRDGGRFGDRPAFEDRGPRLGDVAFRAQREALEHAQLALKKLAAQAHGEVLTDLLTAWEKRDPEQVPAAQALGHGVTPAARSAWAQSLAAAPKSDDKTTTEALLRLEIAAEAPTPAEHVSARRMLQLQLLTRRNDPSPAQTWAQDAAKVWSSPFDAGNARRMQNVLKVLLKR